MPASAGRPAAMSQRGERGSGAKGRLRERGRRGGGGGPASWD